MKRLGACLILLFFACAAWADQLLLVRSAQNFEEAMSTLQAAIAARGYKVAKVQRVDVGLEAKGYKTDRYRVVFFGRPGEVEKLAAEHPELIPYLPLNVAIFAEEGQTLLTTARPTVLKEFFPQPELAPIFERWEKDLGEIFDEVRTTR
ncbi:MAG: DUF302 domain-containing protein [Burkholderiales bacterium]|jgi:uncharacterized protein (DUF302 family)|nr:DUF302 domain-containing protein [Burkholderiales bacterium]